MICTARPARWMRPLAPIVGGHGTAICANGGVIWDIGGERLMREFPIPCEVAQEVVARLRPVLPRAAWAVERATAFAHEPAYRSRWPVPDDTVVDAVEALLAVAPVKLMLRAPDVTADELVTIAARGGRRAGRGDALEHRRHAAGDERRRCLEGLDAGRPV